MGVYIKGMKMPKDCNTCYISECLLPYSKVVPIGYRHEDCPLVEVAEPHGRLIDADEMIKYIKPWTGSKVSKYIRDRNLEFIYYLQNAETVLETESEDEE